MPSKSSNNFFYKRPIDDKAPWENDGKKIEDDDALHTTQVAPFTFQSLDVEVDPRNTSQADADSKSTSPADASGKVLTLYGWLMCTGQKISSNFKDDVKKIMEGAHNPSAFPHDHFSGANSSCILFFHGNNASFTTDKVIELYKPILKTCRESKGAKRCVYLLAFDYRGYGCSKGHTTQKGLTRDGIAALNLVLQRLQVPPANVLLLGHSLGAAIVTTTYHDYVTNHRNEPLCGLLLSGCFSATRRLMLKYSDDRGRKAIVFKPHKVIPLLLFFEDKWYAKRMMIEIAQSGKVFNICFAHSRRDKNIRSSHSVRMFTELVHSVDGQSRPPGAKQWKRPWPWPEISDETPYKETFTWDNRQKQATLLLTAEKPVNRIPFSESGGHRYQPREQPVLDMIKEMLFKGKGDSQ